MTFGYDQIITSLLHRVGGYVSIPKVELERRSASFHIATKDDGSLHLWLPGKDEGDR